MLEQAIQAYLDRLNADAVKCIHMPKIEYIHYYEDRRRVSRKGNIVITIVQEGEVIIGGPVEDPITSWYEDEYEEVVFGPDGKLIQRIH